MEKTCSKCNLKCILVTKRTICKKCYNLEKQEQLKKRKLEARERICTKCNKTKTLLKNKYWCKECKNECEKKRRALNRDKYNTKSKEYYLKKKNNIIITEINIDYSCEKICSTCNISKSTKEFYLNSLKNATRAECKDCASIKRKQHYINNKDRIIKQTTKYQNNRIKTDPRFKIEKNMRCRLYHALKKKNIKKNNKTFELVGCTKNELISYLEKQFTPEMNWDNYGPYFHIDHIIPCSAWDLTNDLELKACFHYTNLQPLVGPENQSKGDKYCEKEKKIHFDKIKNLILNTE